MDNLYLYSRFLERTKLHDNPQTFEAFESFRKGYKNFLADGSLPDNLESLTAYQSHLDELGLYMPGGPALASV